ncbi:transaldolase/fructose-6-phosphate aldolase [Aureococcus anophagefferens]|nr:transaldolase/fructose-6-phosphate aldolase [Aureococcus anophagefferens]
MRAAALTVLLAAAEALSAPKPRSRLFLDSASLADWQELLPTGLFYGVTTNPTILARDGVSCDVKSVSALARRAVEDYGCRQVMFQAWGGSADLFERSALEVLDKVNLGEHVIVKLPLTRQGVVAAHRLRDEAHLCMTACYAREQAVVANALRADYLAPYLGRMSRGHERARECLAMQRALDGSRAHTRLLVASLRKARSVFDVADVACDVEDEAACIQEAPKNKMIDVAKILGKKKEAA